ncbi:hypothetical protein [Nocardia gipuzkoensis]
MTTSGSSCPATPLTIRPIAPLFVDEGIGLEITAWFLPRSGDRLNFDGLNGQTLVADVTEISNYCDSDCERTES